MRSNSSSSNLTATESNFTNLLNRIQYVTEDLDTKELNLDQLCRIDENLMNKLIESNANVLEGSINVQSARSPRASGSAASSTASTSRTTG